MTGLLTVPVLALPGFDPGAQRVSIELPHGLTIAEIVGATLPAADAADLSLARVALVTPQGSCIVPRAAWHRVRPHAGVRVVIRLIPGKGSLKSVLSIVISIAAVAIGAWVAGAYFAGSVVAAAVVSAGVMIVGQLMLNALIPPVKPDTERKSSYQLSGWKNELRPDGAVPIVFGTMRYAPPFAARPYTEIVGDAQYIRALFLLGEGEVQIRHSPRATVRARKRPRSFSTH